MYVQQNLFHELYFYYCYNLFVNLMLMQVNFEKRHYAEAFSKDDIIYLSSESDNVINALDETKVYIIGGLVDHNAHKVALFILDLEIYLKMKVANCLFFYRAYAIV